MVFIFLFCLLFREGEWVIFVIWLGYSSGEVGNMRDEGLC